MIDKVRYSYKPDFLDLLVKQSNGKAFRKRVEPCPYCEPECGMFQKPKFAVDWDKEGTVREIVFIRNQLGLYYKRGYAVMVSACPRCNKLSFHHREIERLLHDGWADKEVVQAEIDAWEQESIDQWDNSLCKRCAVEKVLERDKFGYKVKCMEGSGGSPKGSWEVEPFRCTKFVPAEPDTCEYCGKAVDGGGTAHSECQKKMDEIERVSYNEWLKRQHELGCHKDKKFKE